MILIKKSQLPVSEETFRQMYQKYRQDMDNHKNTVNVPAPWPEHEIFRTLYQAGGFVIEDDVTPALYRRNAQATEARKATYRRARFTDRRKL